MKNLSLAVAFAGMLAAPALKAGVVNIADGLGNGPGGAFQITVTDGAGLGGSASSFQSFCVERNEYISVPGNGYTASLGPDAINGGVGGPQPDPISLATAWLYSNFRNGTLSTAVPSYTVSAAGNDALQDAIWFLEEEIASTSGLASTLVAAAQLAEGAGWNNPANGQYGVYAMNLSNGPSSTGAPDYLNQTLLAIVPEPSTYLAGAGALGLLLLGVGARSKKSDVIRIG
jgi:hypothetical protein